MQKIKILNEVVGTQVLSANNNDLHREIWVTPLPCSVLNLLSIEAYAGH